MNKLKCSTLDGEEVSNYLYAHFKLDGNFTTVQKSKSGRLSFWSSIGTDLTESLERLLATPAMLERLPCGLELYGELWVPGAPASYIKTAIKEQSGRLRFDCFATSCHAEDEYLENVETDCVAWGIPFVPYYNTRINEVFKRKLPSYCDVPIEGYVFKNGNRLDFAKWKPVKTIDLIVTGFQDGKGKYFGLIGAALCSTSEGIEVAKVSGMDDSTRIEVSENENDFMFKVVEVAYQSVGSKGRLRHPRFVRWREDKNCYQCPLGQDPDLERYWDAASKESNG